MHLRLHPKSKKLLCKRCFENTKKQKVPLSIHSGNGNLAPEIAEVTPCVDKKTHEKYKAHHWLIDTPQGPVSKGICKQCGKEAEFKNALPSDYMTWQEFQEERAKALFKIGIS
ncbi:MAG: hypothetical protein HYS60_01920 [Candidatus Wildermuthbacteria bacterium]|nr:hypothetical protein [Candidatus Wildermuthbacteria bacterium]